jgi:hypothetical protein
VGIDRSPGKANSKLQQLWQQPAVSGTSKVFHSLESCRLGKEGAFPGGIDRRLMIGSRDPPNWLVASGLKKPSGRDDTRVITGVTLVCPRPSKKFGRIGIFG